MCIPGIIFEYENETQYQEEKKKTKAQEEKNKSFYSKLDEKWDYYSGLPSTKSYEMDH
jgi:hypothetical protein|tara:strand:+ start:207 stop:380 length:174 start_codon:yes stop_codon:yes gene_type:complete